MAHVEAVEIVGASAVLTVHAIRDAARPGGQRRFQRGEIPGVHDRRTFGSAKAEYLGIESDRVAGRLVQGNEPNVASRHARRKKISSA